MEKFKYQEIENYENKKNCILNAIQRENGGVLPIGYDNDMFVSALIKIIEHLENSYKTTIKVEDIPDAKNFTRQKEEYSITSFVLNRVLKNVKSVNFRDIDKNNPHTMGGYRTFKDGTHDITLYTSVLTNNLDFLQTRKINDKFETDEDFRKTLIEETMIHELIHAISDNGFGVGFDKNKNNTSEVSFNEGMTENLAIEIAGLRDFSNTLYRSGENDFVVKTQTNSGYMLETNIINLIRVASKEDMTISYLVNPNTIKFGALDKIKIYNSTNPLETIMITLNKAVEESKKTKKGYNAITNESVDIQDSNFESFQELQTILIEDIFQNKYSKVFIDKIRQSGKSPTQEEYNKFKKDMLIIGRCLVPTLTYKLDIEEKKEFAQNDNFATSQDIIKLIQDKAIEPTPNILRYRDLLFAMENIQKDFSQDLTM